MIELLQPLVPFFKAVHIGTLCLWCAGLIALPLMLAQQNTDSSQRDYHLIRKATHLAYTLGLTPTAVLTVIAGTWLIFMREVFHPWFYAKLLFVMPLIGAHVWNGHVLARMAENSGQVLPVQPYWPLGMVLVGIAGILVLVLAKPEFAELQFPSWLLEPVGAELPFEVPRR